MPSWWHFCKSVASTSRCPKASGRAKRSRLARRLRCLRPLPWATTALQASQVSSFRRVHAAQRARANLRTTSSSPANRAFVTRVGVGRCPTSCCSASSGGQSTCGPSASAPLFDIPAGRHRISLSLHSYNAFQNELGTIRKVLSSPTIAKSRTRSWLFAQKLVTAALLLFGLRARWGRGSMSSDLDQMAWPLISFAAQSSSPPGGSCMLLSLQLGMDPASLSASEGDARMRQRVPRALGTRPD